MLPLRPLLILLTMLLVACSVQGGAKQLPPERDLPAKSGAEAVVSDDQTNGLPPGFDVQGHRGARGLRPENSLPAFETALDLGVSTLELDLHFTADQQVVIWHDDKIDKEKCGLDPDTAVDVRDPDSLVDWGSELMISQLTLEQVQAYRCDRNPDPERFPMQQNGPTDLAGDYYRIISLAELFDFVDTYAESEQKGREQRENADMIVFNMETKRKPDSPNAIGDGFDGVNPGPFEMEILDLIKEYGLEDRVTIQSFDHRSLWVIRSINPDISLAALTSGGVPNPPGYAEKGATIWSPNYRDVSPAMVSKSHKVGLQVIPWTVNEAGDMRDLIEMGVDGIISDRPDVLLELDRAGE
ncbi:MAG: hypothetical protein GWP61_18215 [Chloroflexi bacterium]|jgi:glycerophosphoryl diester phosphodiesterase|nr:hypothetical protein [Chloroflexota bacterium]